MELIDTQTGQNQIQTFVTNDELDSHFAFVQKKKRERYGGQMKKFSLFSTNFTIGPDYKFFICAFVSMLIVGIAIIILEITFDVSKIYITFTILMNVFELSIYFVLVVSDPGIIYNSLDPKKEPSSKFCYVCDLYVQKATMHCNICNVCIQGLDHHCPWSSKCIGKNNLSIFYTFIISTLLFILVNTVGIPFLFLDL